MKKGQKGMRKYKKAQWEYQYNAFSNKDLNALRKHFPYYLFHYCENSRRVMSGEEIVEFFKKFTQEIMHQRHPNANVECIDPYEAYCRAQTESDDLHRIEKIERKKREQRVLENAKKIGLQNHLFALRLQNGEFVSNAAFKKLEAFMGDIEEVFTQLGEGKKKAIQFAEMNGFITEKVYIKLKENEYITLEEIKSFKKCMELKIRNRERKRKSAQYKEIKQLLKELPEKSIVDHPILLKLSGNEQVSAQEVETFKDILKAEINVERKKELKKEEEERAMRYRDRVETLLTVAEALEFEEHEIYRKLKHNEEVSQEILDDFEKLLVITQKSEDQKKDMALRIPILMEKAEELYNKLSAAEQREYSKRMNQYREAFQKMKKPQKLKKNLEWIIKKMTSKK